MSLADTKVLAAAQRLLPIEYGRFNLEQQPTYSRLNIPLADCTGRFGGDFYVSGSVGGLTVRGLYRKGFTRFVEKRSDLLVDRPDGGQFKLEHHSAERSKYEQYKFSLAGHSFKPDEEHLKLVVMASHMRNLILFLMPFYDQYLEMLNIVLDTETAA